MIKKLSARTEPEICHRVYKRPHAKPVQLFRSCQIMGACECVDWIVRKDRHPSVPSAVRDFPGLCVL